MVNRTFRAILQHCHCCWERMNGVPAQWNGGFLSLVSIAPEKFYEKNDFSINFFGKFSQSDNKTVTHDEKAQRKFPNFQFSPRYAHKHADLSGCWQPVDNETFDSWNRNDDINM